MRYLVSIKEGCKNKYFLLMGYTAKIISCLSYHWDRMIHGAECTVLLPPSLKKKKDDLNHFEINLYSCK